MLTLTKITAAVALALGAQASLAGTFDSGIPGGWTCTGSCGTLGANNVVTLAPGGGSAYGWVSTNGGVVGVSPFSTGVETNGSKLVSSSFSAGASDALDFHFNYVTSDGSGFSDYGWARVLNASDSSQVALLFTARTQPSGTIVPGFGLPPIAATLTPPSAPIIPGGVSWAPLLPNNSPCFAIGCGYTGWIESQYTFAAAGSYKLEFGVINSKDTAWNSGMAFDGITIAGKPIPEPATLALLGLGFAGLGFSRRGKQKEIA